MIKIQIKSIFGSVLFEYEKENNTIKDTLQEAVKNRANLDGANLYGANLVRANLYGANLDGANLDGANLVRANLYGANLYGANLDGANLYGANLYGANLYGANLVRANLYGANLDGANLDGAKIPMWSKWSVTFVNGLIKIGCKEKTIAEWDEWFSGKEEYSTERNTNDFKRIEAHYRAAKAFYEFLEGKV